MTSLLSVENLSAFYGQTQVLTDISFTLSESGCTGLIGPNGAGKTTLIKALLGNVEAHGDVIYGGTTIRQGGLQIDNLSTIRMEIGYVPERSKFYKHLSCQELLQFVGNLLEYDENVIHDKVSKLIDHFSLTRWEDRLVQELSKGNLQRLSLAITFMQEPRLLLLDEPLSGLSPGGRKQLLHLIQSFTTTGLSELGMDRPGTALISSHILGELEQICDNYILLNEVGEMIWKGSVDEISQIPDISSIEELYHMKLDE